jgi:hypothetical protein
MAEWFKAAVLKTVGSETGPGVRIPLSPPTFAHARHPPRGLRLASQAEVVHRSAKREGGRRGRAVLPPES